jgi:hypothetical protein
VGLVELPIRRFSLPEDGAVRDVFYDGFSLRDSSQKKLPIGCFRHQLLLGRQTHSPSSHANGWSRLEDEYDILQHQKGHLR